MTTETIVLACVMAGIIIGIINGKQHMDQLSPEERETARKETEDDLRIW